MEYLYKLGGVEARLEVLCKYSKAEKSKDNKQKGEMLHK